MFVYLAALNAGWNPEDTIANTAIETGAYRPKNSRATYSDEITLEEAFASSSNVAAVRLFNQVGSKEVIRTARSLGVTSDLPEGDPSLALGTSSMSLLELTAAYAGVAANQYPVEPYAFEPEEESWWDWLGGPEQSASGRIHGDIEQMLRRATAPDFGFLYIVFGLKVRFFNGYGSEFVVRRGQAAEDDFEEEGNGTARREVAQAPPRRGALEGNAS